MGHVFSRATHTKAGGQHNAASSQGAAHRRAAPTGSHDIHSVASQLSAKQSSHLLTDGPHQKGEKATKKKTHVPKIVITGPLEDSTSFNSLNDLPESQTIRDVVDYGPYYVHRKPSTAEPYRSEQQTA